MKIQIRKAVKKDFEEIDAIYSEGGIEEIKERFPKRTYKSIYNEFKNKKSSRRKLFIKEINAKNITFIVLQVNDQIIGFGEGIVETSYGGRMGLIDKIYLNKTSRRKGFGAKLVKFLMKEMKNKKVDFFEWRVYSVNKGSLNLAGKFGFEVFSIRLRKNSKLTNQTH